MDYCSNFRYDLEVGQAAERLVGEMLANQKIEVKNDLKAIKTGNIFVEYESRGKPSGIARSEAEHYCFVIEDIKIFIPTAKLKELVEPLKGTKADRRGGDNNTSKGVLIKLTSLIPSSK
jgi:hypothetical protein